MTDQLYLPYIGPAAPPSPCSTCCPICAATAESTRSCCSDKDGNQHQARHQTQIEHDAGYGWSSWFQTKGNEISAEYEWLGPMASSSIAASTPPRPGRYYRLVDDDQRNIKMSKWCPRFWSPGDIYERNPFVFWHEKAGCKYLAGESDYQPTWLQLHLPVPVLAHAARATSKT